MRDHQIKNRAFEPVWDEQPKLNKVMKVAFILWFIAVLALTWGVTYA